MTWLVNGRVTESLPVTDRGVAYGDGLFETMAWHDGQVRHFDQHWARLSLGCERLAIPRPDQHLVLQEIAQVASGTQCVIKLLLTRGAGDRGYSPDPASTPTRIVAGLSWPSYPEHCAEHGVRMGVVTTRLGVNPALAGLKTLNRLEQVLGARERQQQGWDEGLMLDVTERVIGGTMSNVFLVCGDELVTPSLEGCGVAGVMRHQVLAAAPALGLTVREEGIRMPRLLSADELFLTNALFGVWPVASLDDARWRPGPVTRAVKDQVT